MLRGVIKINRSAIYSPPPSIFTSTVTAATETTSAGTENPAVKQKATRKSIFSKASKLFRRRTPVKVQKISACNSWALCCQAISGLLKYSPDPAKKDVTTECKVESQMDTWGDRTTLQSMELYLAKDWFWLSNFKKKLQKPNRGYWKS